LIKNNFKAKSKYSVSSDVFVSYIKKKDFNTIMSLFSRMLNLNHWKDYSFTSEKNTITFCFYKNSLENPIYKIIYEKKYNNHKQWVVFQQNTKVRTSESLEKIIKWLESRYLIKI
jgi:hypothetical protein|tara:strand:+ start:109 stop:453 length:345 start_codon:yes stop_codon:yes gene_type:complete